MSRPPPQLGSAALGPQLLPSTTLDESQNRPGTSGRFCLRLGPPIRSRRRLRLARAAARPRHCPAPGSPACTIASCGFRLALPSAQLRRSLTRGCRRGLGPHCFYDAHLTFSMDSTAPHDESCELYRVRSSCCACFLPFEGLRMAGPPHHCFSQDVARCAPRAVRFALSAMLRKAQGFGIAKGRRYIFYRPGTHLAGSPPTPRQQGAFLTGGHVLGPDYVGLFYRPIGQKLPSINPGPTAGAVG